ncbi:MAG: type II toxin-antitoxin system VapC family toxin [Dehalococcoidia bacterium]|nr:type II toxin-antitoxin system VapC family toxin [Dehalococcoidia bacterium]
MTPRTWVLIVVPATRRGRLPGCRWLRIEPSIMFLLDSDVLIWHLRGKPHGPVQLSSLLDEGLLCTSTLVWFEVLRGVFPHERSATLALLDALESIDVDTHVADLGGTLWKTYRERGRELGAVDCLIAATALQHDLTLVPLNLKNFPMPELRVYGRELN